jgi:hypothetical protein
MELENVHNRAWIFKLLRVYSKESIPPVYLACRVGRQPYSYSVPSLHRLFKVSSTEESHNFFLSWNWLLRANTASTCHSERKKTKYSRQAERTSVFLRKIRTSSSLSLLFVTLLVCLKLYLFFWACASLYAPIAVCLCLHLSVCTCTLVSCACACLCAPEFVYLWLSLSFCACALRL